ncbi:MAG: hypothetical protein DLM68_07390 [Hyphomicrobiales bacterium]|nr:MAG: hypothetical protein DLM68_07390 [Hyphomicrobiales bacterium]
MTSSRRSRTDPYRFLICADKFQMGYDEPLLHKPLSGIKAMQTLSSSTQRRSMSFGSIRCCLHLCCDNLARSGRFETGDQSRMSPCRHQNLDCPGAGEGFAGCRRRQPRGHERLAEVVLDAPGAIASSAKK